MDSQAVLHNRLQEHRNIMSLVKESKTYDKFESFINSSLDEHMQMLKQQLHDADRETKLKVFSAFQERMLESADDTDDTFRVFVDELYPFLVKSLVSFVESKRNQECVPITDYDKTITTGEAASLLGFGSVNSVKARIDDFKILGYKDGYHTKIPAWQFNDNQLIAGIDDVLLEIGENGVAAERLLITPLQNRNGDCIADVLRRGDVKLAIEMVRDIKSI